jgi:acetolactate synthase I/III small subunit
MTIVVNGDDKILEQVKKQLNKLIDIIYVKDYIRKEHIDKELVLFKIAVDKKTKSKALGILKKSPAHIVKAIADTVTVEITGTQDDIEKLLNALSSEGYKIKEMVRTGRIAMEL